MDSTQINHVISRDSYLKKLSIKFVFESEVPEVIPLDHAYFLLIPNEQSQSQTKSRVLGHWCLVESLKVQGRQDKNCISFWDPYGSAPSPGIYGKLLGSALTHDADLFINKTCLQIEGSTICGILCTYILLMRARKISPADILRKKVSKSQRVNASVLVDLVNSILPLHVKKVTRFSLEFL